MLPANCQPTIIREKTSITKLKNATPSQQRRYVKSATHRRFGRVGGEVPLDEIRRPARLGVSVRGPPRLPATLRALDPVGGHQPLHLTARDPLAGAHQRLPHPPVPVREVVLRVRLTDHRQQPLVLQHRAR